MAADPGLAAAHDLAPDFVARVREAQLAADRESSAEGRSEQLRRLQYLTTAARAEAERIALLRKAETYEQRIAEATGRRAALERESSAQAQARALEQAAAQERDDAHWALSALARAAPLSAAERDRLWEFCTRRAQALVAAAAALGAPAEPITRAELQLTAARTAKLPERVSKARQALSAAYSALGTARARRDAPSTAEHRDLLARVHELGLVAHADERGLTLDGELPRSAGSRESGVRLALLAELLAAFPHGPVSLACGAAQRCDGDITSPLRARLGERLQLAPRGELAGAVVRVWLPAYVAPAADRRAQ